MKGPRFLSCFPGSPWLRSPIFHAALLLAALLVLSPAPGFELFKQAPSLGFPEDRVNALTGRLLDDPRILAGRFSGSGNRAMARLEIGETRALGLPGTSGSLRGSGGGRVLVFFPGDSIPRIREFGRGAEVYVEGRFVREKPGPSYGGRLFTARAVHVLTAAPALERLRTVVRNGVLKRMTGTKNNWGGLAAALILGTRENLEDETASRFRDAGVSHVLALSGMHLAFVSGLLALFLKPLLGKKGAALGGLIFILGYIFLVGPQPSLIRAGIMYTLGAVSILGGMGRQPILALAAAFCLQTLWDPPAALGPSFILSYTALGGILLLSEPFSVLLRGRLPGWLARPLAASLGAFSFTIPAVTAFFGVLRPVGILAGFAVLPLVSLFMALAGSYLLMGCIPPAGYVLEGLLNAVQGLLNRVVHLASLVPGIELSFPLALFLCPLGIALVLIAGGYCRNYRSRLAPFD